MFLLHFYRNGLSHSIVSPYISALHHGVKKLTLEKWRIRDKDGWIESSGDWTGLGAFEPDRATVVWHKDAFDSLFAGVE